MDQPLHVSLRVARWWLLPWACVWGFVALGILLRPSIWEEVGPGILEAVWKPMCGPLAHLITGFNDQPPGSIGSGWTVFPGMIACVGFPFLPALIVWVIHWADKRAQPRPWRDCVVMSSIFWHMFGLLFYLRITA